MVDGLVPGVRVAGRGVLFQQQVIGNRFDGDQTDLRMKGFVFAQRNLPRRHLGGELLLLLLAVLGEQRFQVGGEGLQRAVGSRQKLVQPAQLQEPAQRPQTAIVGLPEDQMQSHMQMMEEVNSVWGVEEVDNAVGPTAVLTALAMPPQAVSQGTVGASELVCDRSRRLPPKAERLCLPSKVCLLPLG